MRRDLTPTRSTCSRAQPYPVSQACCILLTALGFLSAPLLAKNKADETPLLMVRIEVPSADLMQAVEEVAQDQIVHGTYSYEKERILYGAHSANEARSFGQWKGSGTAVYKVAANVLAPRFFKDTGDIGTISVRYVIEAAGPNAAILRVDAVFVDARGVHHASEGNVEAAEYTAIQEHLRKIQAARQQAAEGMTSSSTSSAPSTSQAHSSTWQQAAAATAPVAPQTVPELQKEVDALRRQVELRVKDQGAQLKAAPFHTATTLETLPADSQVLIVVLSPYWYGVETVDGHHGWIHHSQLEPLP